LLDHQRKQGFIRVNSFEYLVANRVEEVVPKLRNAAGAIPSEELRSAGAKLVTEEM
jgi:hypothetical protein